MRLEQPAAVVAALGRLLGAEERSRADAFLRARDRDRYTVAHGALRDVLARYVPTSPHELEYGTASSGKPVLRCEGPHFSLSHSGDLALAAVSHERPIGVDLERVRHERDHEGVARRFFTPAEVALLAGTEEDARGELFFRLWTCKEACLKEDGRGIAGLAAVETTLAADGAVGARDSRGPWAVSELRPAPGYAGAVAARGPGLAPRLLEWDPSLAVA